MDMQRDRQHRRGYGTISRWMSIALVALLLTGNAGAWVASHGAATASSVTVGYRDFAWSAAGVNGPTAEKPQSKLWFNDGIWWADMFDNSTMQWRIYRFDATSQSWMQTGTPRSRASGTALPAV